MTDTAATLFAVPPFPGAKPYDVIRTAAVRTVERDEAETLIAAVRRECVGGRRWWTGEPWNWFREPKALGFDADDTHMLLAAIAGCTVRCDGAGAFAALSGLVPGTTTHDAVMQDLVSAHLLASVSWHDPFSGKPTAPTAVIAQMGEWRRLIEANGEIAAAFGFAAWKQDTVAAMLWDGSDRSPFRAASTGMLDRIAQDAMVAVWKARVPPAFLVALEVSGRRLLEVEDGFIRSIGLGADCVPPLSIVVDDLGAHYDPRHPSRLERIIAESEPSPEKLARARALREMIAASGISKYGVGGDALPRPAGDRLILLVVGQVEDDRSVQLGGCGLASNHDLLRRVRTANPDAHIVYRPHPDVEAGHRKGFVPVEEVLALADSIDADSAISALIAMADEIHVLTSLAGFEALLNDKAVVTHGVPFYAGWGLTTDLGPVPARRTPQRSIDALVAAVLIDYPRYLDPVTGLPGDAELLIRRMGAGIERKNAALVGLRKGIGRVNRLLARVRDKI